MVHLASGFTRCLTLECSNAIHATRLSSRVPVHAQHRSNQLGSRFAIAGENGPSRSLALTVSVKAILQRFGPLPTSSAEPWTLGPCAQQSNGTRGASK